LTIIDYKGVRPTIGENCFIAENALISGRVSIGDNCSVWFGASIRAEAEIIRIGYGSNIQDCCVVHTDWGFPSEFGDNISVGHGAIIHGAAIGSNCLIGMGSILLNGSKIGKNSIVAAGSLVTQGAEFPENSLVLGSPAKAKRILTEQEINGISANALHYDEFRAEYLANAALKQ